MFVHPSQLYENVISTSSFGLSQRPLTAFRGSWNPPFSFEPCFGLWQRRLTACLTGKYPNYFLASLALSADSLTVSANLPYSRQRRSNTRWVWEQTNGERHRGTGAVGVWLSSACECKRTANGIGQPPQCRFIVQHPPGFDKIVDMDMSAQCRFMVQHPPWPRPEFPIEFAPLTQPTLLE
jgi:hypothetical protein